MSAELRRVVTALLDALRHTQAGKAELLAPFIFNVVHQMDLPSEQPVEWVDEKPNYPGWYWYDAFDGPECVQVMQNGERLFIGGCSGVPIALMNRRWSSRPIFEPEPSRHSN